MKILFINYMETKYPGGINKTVRELAKNLALKGHDVVVIQPDICALPDNENYEGFRIIRIKSYGFKYFYGFNTSICKYIKKFIKVFSPDLVHVHGCHNIFPLEAVFYIKKFYPKQKIILSPHLDVASSSWAGEHLWRIYKFLLKKVFEIPDAIIAASDFEASNLLSYGVNRDKISVIGHGVSEISLQKKQYNKFKLMYAGHLIKRKGVNHVLEALRVLIHELNYHDVSLTIVGDGPEEKKLKNLAKRFSIDKYITWKNFLGRTELVKEIKNANVLLLLSKSEAYGIIVAESLAYGTPVIVTKKTALKEFLNEPGCFGVGYPPDPYEVATLLADIKKKKNIKCGPFSDKIRLWKDVIDDYETLYLNLVGGD